MSFCIVSGCKNRKRNKNYEQLEKEKGNNVISFHMFPKDIERKQKWLEALNLINYNPPKTGAVCSEHFKKQDFIMSHSLRKLKKDALPCLAEGKATDNEGNNVNTCYTDMDRDINIKMEVNYQEYSTSMPPVDNEDNSSNICHKDTTEDIDIKREINYQHRSTSISPERILNSPIKDQMRKIHKNDMKRLKRQLCVSSYKIKKAQQTIKSLKSILKDLEKRNLLTSEDIDIHEHLHEDECQTSC